MTKTKSGVVAALVWACTPLAVAQPASVAWSSVERITKGNCGEGAIADVIESPGKLNIRIVIDGKQTAHFDVTLAADGSGTAPFAGATGPNVMEIPAGTGKRPMKNFRLDGTCQWSWSPR